MLWAGVVSPALEFRDLIQAIISSYNLARVGIAYSVCVMNSFLARCEQREIVIIFWFITTNFDLKELIFSESSKGVLMSRSVAGKHFVFFAGTR